ncbi:RNA polymerase subunit sigma [Streptomyces sp. KAU_LT]|uniref:RNA polymerase subunit sigma n=1 Tax=Streptomyces sp. KAU_LT TaxID=3046669 RepID=UPI0024B66A8A|nr:RNA polymerase subunit sigma [Streptomyces sp. KAU_LT]MDI9829737.1 RNA polymerase subunit sigma [Streptomyces sp. KAU_LT]
MAGADDTAPLAELLDERQHLIDVAGWMLGPGAAAEEAVTDTYRRWYGLSDDERTGISDPRMWLTRNMGTICLARLSAPARPLPGQDDVDAAPEPGQDLPETISDVLLHALDTLTPSERAAFVLNDVFAMPPRTVADVVGRTPRECAELTDRARRSLRAARARPTPAHQHDRIVRAVRDACALDDTRHLVSLLSRDAIAFFDGGGKIRALTRPLHGAQQVARALLTLLVPGSRTPLHLTAVNGRTAIVVRHHEQVAAVISFDITDQRVTHVWAVLNPDKLRGWNRPH